MDAGAKAGALHPAILIAAQSGRALAAAARRAKLRPFVADLFGDDDTLALAAGWRRIAGRLGCRLARRSVIDALAQLQAEAGGTPGVVLGSGFESDPALVAIIDERFRVIGAKALTVARLKDPIAFASLLAARGVAHPRVTLGPVDDPANWLAKRQGGSGGGHIRKALPGQPPRGFYHQRRIADGRRISLAFLADGRSAQIIAASEQWGAPEPDIYRFAGAIELTGDAVPDLGRAESALGQIVAATQLRGLASADGLLVGETWWLLEINPRPGATLDILDRRPTPLMARHLAACGGAIGAREAAPAGICASEILYADRRIARMPALDWPNFVHDRPRPGSAVPRGGPICTVTAEGRNDGAARALLAARTGAIRERLRRGEEPEGRRAA